MCFLNTSAFEFALLLSRHMGLLDFFVFLADPFFITERLTLVTHPLPPPPPQGDRDQGDQTRIPGEKKFGLLDKVQLSLQTGLVLNKSRAAGGPGVTPGQPAGDFRASQPARHSKTNFRASRGQPPSRPGGRRPPGLPAGHSKDFSTLRAAGRPGG